MSVSFLSVLRGEALKTRRSWGFRLSLLGPLAVSLIIFAYFVKESAEFSKSEANLWFSLGRYHFNFFFLLYPLFVALVAFLVSNIEHRAKGFKLLFALPAPKIYFFSSKLIILLAWLSASLLLSAALIYGMGYLLEWLFPGMPFDRFAPVAGIPTFLWKLGIALMAILAIHYFLSLYFDNFILSVGSACFLLIFGMITASWKYGHWIPYTYSTRLFLEYMSNGESAAFGQREIWISLGYTAVFLVAGFWLFSRKQVKE